VAEIDDMFAASEILDLPQFSRHDVLAITGLTDAQLQNTVARGFVVLGDDHSPGTGNRRMYSGGDILRLVTTQQLTAIGFPARSAYIIANQVAARARLRVRGLLSDSGVLYALYPVPGDDWHLTPVYRGSEAPEPQLPPAVLLFDVDEVIAMVLAKLLATVAEEPMPEIPQPWLVASPSPYSPENDFFRAWTKDEDGHDLLVGLTFAETEELERLRDRSRRSDPVADKHRFLELSQRHETARLQRMGREHAERLAAEGGE